MTIQRFLALLALGCGLLAILLLAARPLLAADPIPDAPPVTPKSTDLPVDVDAHFQALIAQNLHRGIAVGLIDAEGIRFASYGLVEKEGGEVDPDTIFEIGSISKVFNGVLLADMAERGLVGLDDPVARHLPAGQRVPERGRAIQLIDLVTHTSGLPRLPKNLKPKDNANPYVDYTPERLYAFLDSHRLRRHVGAQYEYSNLGAGLLGFALAQRGGRSWEALVRQAILEPLGMKSTAVTLEGPLQERFAQGHDRLAAPVAAWDLTTLAGAGALRSSARDMATFIAASLGLHESRLLGALRAAYQERVATELAGGGVGLGWHLRRTDNATIVWHNGGTGGFRSFAGFIAEQQKGVVLLTNSARDLDGIGFHLLDSALAMPEIPKRRKFSLFAKD